jgi:outer membrane protein OmpA-like peptidoglycan-associated protein
VSRLVRASAIATATLTMAWALVGCGGTQSTSVRPKVIIEGSSIVIVDEHSSIPIEVHFELDSDVLDESSLPALDVVALFLSEHEDLLIVEIHGHTDERGSRAHNQKLSRRRAEAVVGYLVDRGVAPARLRAVGFGADRPAAEGADESAYSLNRRVEFVISSRTGL